MKKTAVILLLIVAQCFCSLFRSKIPPYPSGIIFPLEKEAEITYEGEIIDLVQRLENKLFLSTRKGNVYCIDGQQRRILWEHTCSDPLASPPYLGASCIFVFDERNTIYCLNQAGELLWNRAVPGEITSQIGESQNQVYLGTKQGILYCLSAENGETLWSFQAEGPIRSNPVPGKGLIIFGCDDHNIYFLDRTGNLVGKYDAGDRTGKTLCVDQNRLYFGTADQRLHCLDIDRRQSKWTIRTGGATFVPPVLDEKRIFFLCWNCVLYCLNKKNGTILWWNSVPSRSYYRLEVIQDKVVVSSLSSRLVCFHKETGEEKGVFEAPQEIRSNPLWMAPYLLINLYDRSNGTGTLSFLKKEVKVAILPSLKTPQDVHQEITFKVKPTGFYMAKYEFSLTRLKKVKLFPDHLFFVQDGEKQIVQEESDSSTWSWFPEQEGIFLIEVEVKDEKQKVSARYPFVINKQKAEVSLASSSDPSRQIGREIFFKAEAKGLENPLFVFSLHRLKTVNADATQFFLVWEGEKKVQGPSEVNTWSWIPERSGFYVVKVTASDSQDKVEAETAFLIREQEIQKK
jgi:outer membrane protein assembly factor BamB